MSEFLLPADHPALVQYWQFAAYSVPIFFLLQLVALGFLLRRTYAWAPDRLGRSRFERVMLQLGVGIAPALMLFVSTAFSGGYQLERGHWFFHTNDGSAGLVLFPLYLIGSIYVWISIARPSLRRSSWLYFIVVTTLLIVCLWYAIATRYFGMSDDGPNGASILAYVPLLAAVNYALLLVDVWRDGQINHFPKTAIATWVAGLIASLWLKAVLAIRIFQSLPVERPVGYGDCFVVTAAATGHPRFVRSWFDPDRQRTVNRQLLTLQALEAKLRVDWPNLHRHMRRCYNRIGPVIAALIQWRFVADAAYLALKPIEWIARFYPGVALFADKKGL